MVHESPRIIGADRVDRLFQAQRTHCDDGHDLSLTPGEQACAMGSGQETGGAGYRADLVQCPPVRTDMLLEDASAYGLTEHGFETFADLRLGVILFKSFSDQRGYLVLTVVHLVHAGVLGEKVAPAGADDLFDFVHNGVRGSVVVIDLNLGFADFVGQFFNQANRCRVGFLGLADGFQDDFFGDFIRTCFHHQDSIA